MGAILGVWSACSNSCETFTLFSARFSSTFSALLWIYHFSSLSNGLSVYCIARCCGWSTTFFFSLFPFRRFRCDDNWMKTQFICHIHRQSSVCMMCCECLWQRRSWWKEKEKWNSLAKWISSLPKRIERTKSVERSSRQSGGSKQKLELKICTLDLCWHSRLWNSSWMLFRRPFLVDSTLFLTTNRFSVFFARTYCLRVDNESVAFNSFGQLNAYNKWIRKTHTSSTVWATG